MKNWIRDYTLHDDFFCELDKKIIKLIFNLSKNIRVMS